MTTLRMFDSLCDNTLTHVLFFLDFHSAVRVAKVTSKALSQRLANCTHVWKDVFRRHCFAPFPGGCDDYLQECYRRRQLLRNLIGQQRRSKTSFNLPNRYFYFVPVTPDENDEWDIAPPVDFDCPSFLLTSPGTSGELVFLDPFDGSLVVQESCLDNAVASDEAMMEQAMTDAATLIKHRDTLGLKDLKEEHIAGAVIEESVYRNHNMEHYQQEPTAVLMDLGDYYNTDLSQYFILRSRSRPGDNLTLGEDEEVEIDMVGIESKPILMGETIVGTAVAVGRTFCSDADSWSSEPKVVSELIVWKREEGGDFNQRFVCRVRSTYITMDMDPVFQRVYFVFPFNEGPFRRFDADLHDEHTDNVDFSGGCRVVAAYPLRSYPDKDNGDTRDSGPQHFPKPEFILKCDNAVSAFAVTPGGEIVLASTTKGTIEVWETGDVGSGVKRLHVVDVKRALATKRQAFDGMPTSMESAASEEGEIRDRAAAAQSPLLTPHPSGDRDGDGGMDDVQPVAIESVVSPIVTSFHFPSHCQIDSCGFMTLNHIHGQGSWLLFWTKEKRSGSFEANTTIALPLSSRRKPCIHYDGRRIVVFGQDHIGMIILVYRVLNSWEDLGAFEDKVFSKGDEAAGVRNLTSPHRVKFVNRIRHGALGGMQYYDSAYMTANERFIVVNTKTGNLLGGGSTPCTDGLLVLDLEELP
ncbi:hypothetical protein MHU86_11520 [Fragilaria crotonensis]|nr:hypothetical protein MHU86_11520 [Fragilaria crotonensis]